MPDGLDPVRIGGQSGFLWVKGQFCLAGHGVAHRIPIRLSDPQSVKSACDQLSTLGAGGDRSPIAFGALPFARSEEGQLIVPRFIVGNDGGNKWLTVQDGTADHLDALETLMAFDDPGNELTEPTTFELQSIHPAEFWRDEIVAKAIALINSGRLNKVVLARELEISADSPISAASVLNRLHDRYSTAIRFNVEGFLGASPELLVARAEQVVTAHPLAGTAPRFTDPAEDLASSENLEASVKDQWEHRITINWLLDNLLPFCSYVDADPEPKIVTLANVHHLGTRVEGQLSKPAAHVLELVAALHPTPAVGGAPQDEALRVIAEIEQAERQQYAGPVGWVDGAGNGAFAVGIRSATIKGNTARLFAGVGVVGDSEPQSELDETEAKFQTMRNALLG